MRNRLPIVVLVLAVVAPREARAVPVDFSAGSWIIPMDVCYQPSVSFNGSSYSSTATTSTVYGSTCPDPQTSTPQKDGMLKAYGLVYRLLQHGVPVYYVLNTQKTSVDDVDLTVTNTSGTPVGLLNHSTGAYAELMTSTHTSINYRGAPFIISAADVPTALNLLKTNSDFTGTDPRTGRSYFQDVYIHYAKTNILQAPIRALLNQVPPKIALLDIGGAAYSVLVGYLADAGLNTTGAYATYPSIGSVFTAFDQVTDFTGGTNGGLVDGGFSILWAPHWEGDQSITSTQRDQVVQKIAAFVDAGHPFFAQCAAMATFEGSTPVGTSYGSTTAGNYGYFQTTASSGQKGLKTNQISQSGNFPYNTSQALIVNPSTTLKAWTDPLAQTGDYPLKIVGVQSWVEDFTPASGHSWKPGVNVMLQASSTNPTSINGLPIETVTYKDNDPTKGKVIYLGGHSYGSQSSTCAPTCNNFNQYNMLGLERLILNTLVFLGQQPQTGEYSRSAPIVYSNGKTYLGSYVQQTQPLAAYPPWKGHFREYPAGALSGTNVTSFSAVTLIDWDAATHIQTQATNDTRKIFTGVKQSGQWVQKDFTTANATALGVASTTITSIRTGGLGGIDHSIPAIIGPSSVAGSSTRPTVAYVGALDGMLHCILVSGAVSGYSPGDELWAFVPPSQLQKVVAQTAGVDGSPSVGDAFVDTTGSGLRSWRTLLAIPDGSYAGGTIDLLDVTDPTNPSFLWEASDTFTQSGKTYVMGRAQGAAIAPVMTSTGVKYAVFFATDNTNGTGGNGFNLYALDASNGSVIWRWNHSYANDTTHNDVPGTAAVIDSVGDNGPVDTVYFGDLEGKVWSVKAATGLSPTTLYDAATAHSQANSINFPVESGVVLYRDPNNTDLSIVGVTGGADWVPSSTLSYVFHLDLQNHTSADLYTLPTGDRVYAAPTVSGDSVYFISSTGNIQLGIGNAFGSAGSLYQINLGTHGETTLASVKQGASEVAVDASGNVTAVSTSGITQVGSTATASGQNVYQLQMAQSKPVTVKAWLDLH